MSCNENCNLCPRHEHTIQIGGTVCQPGEGNPDAKLLIIAEAPDKEDSVASTVMRSKFNTLLRNVLHEAMGLTEKDYYITYLVKCKSEEQPTEEEVQACSVYLNEEIKRVQPKVIVTLGQAALNAMYDKAAPNVYRTRGNFFVRNFDGLRIKILPTLSVGNVLKQQSQFKVFAMDLDKAYGEASGIRAKGRRSFHGVASTVEEAKEYIDYCLVTRECCFDFETFNLDVHYGLDRNKATGIAVSAQPGCCYFIPLHHFDTPFTEEEIQEIIDYFCETILENEEIHKIAHNMKFDLHVIRMYRPKVQFKGRLDDTMLMSHLFDETTPNGLKDNVRLYFLQFGDYEQNIGGWKFHEIPLKPLAEYACLDGDLTHRLFVLYESYLLKDERIYLVYRNEICPAFKVLFEAEQTGMLVDRQYLHDAIKEAKALIDKQEKKLRAYPQLINFENIFNEIMVKKELKKMQDRVDVFKAKRAEKKGNAAGVLTKTETALREKIQGLKAGTIRLYEGINFGSPKQLEKLFYFKEGFGFDYVVDKRSGEFLTGTGKEVLIEINDPSGFINDLRIWRSLTKTVSTYLEAIYEKADSNHRIHTSFLQHGTATGRLSSRDPNMQNLPSESKIKDEDVAKVVRMVKKSIIAPPGYTLLQLDYSQAELRLMAFYSKDPVMLDAYANKLDLHAITAAKIMGITFEEFIKLPAADMKTWRTRAKAGNFGLIYKMSAEGFRDYAKLQYGVEWTLAEATAVRNAFFDLYKKIEAYHDLYIAKARKFGYVRTLLGRKRHLPNIHSDNGMKRAEDERAAINSPIQGTAGEFTILAGAICYHRLDPRVQFVLNVHDALYYYVPNELVKDTARILRMTCEDLPIKLYFGKELEGISMAVDIETSTTSWKETAPYIVEN